MTVRNLFAALTAALGLTAGASAQTYYYTQPYSGQPVMQGQFLQGQTMPGQVIQAGSTAPVLTAGSNGMYYATPGFAGVQAGQTMTSSGVTYSYPTTTSNGTVYTYPTAGTSYPYPAYSYGSYGYPTATYGYPTYGTGTTMGTSDGFIGNVVSYPTRVARRLFRR